MVCGNATLWKSAPSTPLTAIATTKIVETVLARNKIPTSIACLVSGRADIGKVMVAEKKYYFDVFFDFSFSQFYYFFF